MIDALEHLLAHADDLGIVDADAERAHTVAGRSGRRDNALSCRSATIRASRFHAVTDLVVDAGRRAPVLFVLDDLQWAGRPTLQLVLHWFRSPLPLRLCLVATHRETPADINDTFDEALAEFHRLEGLTRGRSPASTVRRRRARRGRAGHHVDAVPARDRVLAQQTDGNPFPLGELWRHFVETGALVQDGTWHALPTLDVLRQPRQRPLGGRAAHRPPPRTPRSAADRGGGRIDVHGRVVGDRHRH